MRALSILSILVVVYFSCAVIGYLGVKQGVGTAWWFGGVAIISILAGATLATITTTTKIVLRERRIEQKKVDDFRAKLGFEGQGRD